MTHLLSSEAKEIIVKKVLSGEQTMRKAAASNNVALSTLYEWVKRFKSQNPLNQPVSNSSKPPTTAERFKHLQATFGQEDVIVGAYCRQHGLYPHQLTQWEKEFMTKDVSDKDKKSMDEMRALRAENKSLKKLILRKDKALAETVALLVLKKKAAQLWEDNEED